MLGLDTWPMSDNCLSKFLRAGIEKYLKRCPKRYGEGKEVNMSMYIIGKMLLSISRLFYQSLIVAKIVVRMRDFRNNLV